MAGFSSSHQLVSWPASGWGRKSRNTPACWNSRMKGTTDAAGYSRSRPPLMTKSGLLRRLVTCISPSTSDAGLASTTGWPLSGRNAAHGVVAFIA